VVAWSWPTWVVESETCVGSCVHLVGASISFEKNFYRLPFTPPSLVRRFDPSTWQRAKMEELRGGPEPVAELAAFDA
jgi:hypothetical protein